MSDESTALVPTGGSPEPIPGRCGAKLRGSDPPRYCKKEKLRGRTRCRLHGGMSLMGAESGTWKGRGWSKYMPQRLADQWEIAMNDPELTSLRAELGLLDARVGELIQKLETGDSATAWEHIEGEVMLMRKSLDDGNTQQALMLADKLQDYIRGANSERETWETLQHLIEQRRRIADTERKREEMLTVTMNANQAQMFIGALQRGINDIVTDPIMRRRLGQFMQMQMARNMNVGGNAEEDIIDVEAEIVDDSEGAGEQ